MARFKTPAPAPPSTPLSRRHPMKKDISLVIKFDDLIRDEAVLTAGSEQEFLKFVKNAKEWRRKWRYSEMERQRLNVALNEKENELMGKDHQIKQARKFVEQEQRARMKIEAERDNLQKQLQGVKDLLLADGGKTINNETLERIRRIDVSGFGSKPAPTKSYMNPLIEESAESLLDASELSFEDSRDNILGDSRRISAQQYNRRSSGPKRRSHSFGTANYGSEKLVTKTTVTVGKDGNAQAESFIETYPVTMDMEELKKQRKRSRMSRDLIDEDNSLYAPSAPPMDDMIPNTPSHPVKRTFSNAGSVPSRPHCFQKKTVVVVERCNPCGKRIKFGKTVLKCRDCAAVCHNECKHNVPTPCVANATRTPNAKVNGCYLADFTPFEPPMIPALLDMCIKEVEQRGLMEVGLYRVPGNESEATELLEKLMQGRGPPPRLSKYEIHTITSVIKKFMRKLKEPIIPLSLWHVFVDAANNPDSTFAESDLYQAISELPRPNRDTLAFLMLHLQAVAQNSTVNKMDVDNLAMVMGPTIIGYSSSDAMAILSESDKQKVVMRALLSLSADYWSSFLNSDNDNLFGYLQVPQPKPTKRYFKPMTITSPAESTVTLAVPMTGGPARRTRSKQLSKNFSKRQGLFQSPML